MQHEHGECVPKYRPVQDQRRIPHGLGRGSAQDTLHQSLRKYPPRERVFGRRHVVVDVWVVVTFLDQFAFRRESVKGNRGNFNKVMWGRGVEEELLTFELNENIQMCSLIVLDRFHLVLLPRFGICTHSHIFIEYLKQFDSSQ